MAAEALIRGVRVLSRAAAPHQAFMEHAAPVSFEVTVCTVRSSAPKPLVLEFGLCSNKIVLEVGRDLMEPVRGNRAVLKDEGVLCMDAKEGAIVLFVPA
jgi:hypothetical protein